ncbi:serine-protein kinase RsbW [bacterium BMS3Abin03]|nr:serine-protein kinase RsbW [bacterium BMS3Abin03]
METNKKHSSKLIVKSKTENLSLIRDFISSKASDAGILIEEIENIMLAVDEACTNIIKHAYHSGPGGNIIVKVEYDSADFKITIEDYGNSFNPDEVPDPDLRQYHKDKKVGGLGMYLMKTLMDDVKYVSVPGKYNRVILSKKINVSQN